MSGRKVTALGQLSHLAVLKREIELARLADIARARARLLSAIRELDEAERAPLIDTASQDAPQDAVPDTSQHASQDAVPAPPMPRPAAGQGHAGADAPGDPARASAGAAPPAITNPAMMAAHLRFGRWADAQRSLLNQRLARVSADWLERRPAAARAVGQASVLDRLTSAQARRLRAKQG